MTDNGVGVSKELGETIFCRGVTHGKAGGTGYGLYHAQKFIESWGGELRLLESQQGKTKFEISLPLWEAPSLDLQSTADSREGDH